jgi:hypothetical protein
MSKIRFDTLVPLPSLGGVQLAAIAVRALENFSDLVNRHIHLASIKAAQRLDIAEDFLDLVIVRPDLPAGFEFTGITVAGFRAALLSDRHRPLAESWLSALASDPMLLLHECARQRIAIRPKSACILHLEQWLPKRYEEQPYAQMPDGLQRFMWASETGWKLSKRSRYLVELVSESGSPNLTAPTRGKRFRVSGSTGINWLRWHLYRLLPQSPYGDFLMRLLEDYVEYQLALPSLEESYFSNHFHARNIFAHLRAEFFIDDSGRQVMLLHEIQSDWLRDLRLQRRGKERPQKPYFVGQDSKQRQWDVVPECPVAETWLELALEAAIGIARDRDCQLIAWVPGKIQSELNPGLPLNAASALYDKKVPRLLSKLLNTDVRQPLQVAFPTYQRNVLVAYRDEKGYFLTAADGQTPKSTVVTDEETLMSLYRTQAIPTVEQLPGFDLENAPLEYEQPEYAKQFIEQPKFEAEEYVCG